MTTPKPSEPSAKDDGKVDRIIERIVIDWLQYGETFNEDRAQNALTLIHDLKSQLTRLSAKHKKAVECLEKIGKRHDTEDTEARRTGQDIARGLLARETLAELAKEGEEK